MGECNVFVPFLFIYLYLFFSDSRAGQTGWWIFTRDSSLDVKSRKDVPFWGLNDVPINFGGKTPEKLKFWGREQDFQAWTTKISNPYNLKTTDPIMTKF